MILTYRFRVKDKHASRLNAQARAVNFVWNYCNETQMKAVRTGRRWLSANDLGRLCAGATKEGLDLSANTVEHICRQYAKSRQQHRKPWLRWRGKRSLGWVPFRDEAVRFDGASFHFRRERYDVWLSRVPPGARFGCGSFSQDAKGRWYINIPVEVEVRPSPSAREVGIDLGLKALATLSDGREIAIPQHFRKAETGIAAAQRAGKKRLTAARCMKVAAKRRDYLHKASTALAKEYGLIVVGGVSASKLARTKMAKSVLDAGWSDFRHMISYKAIALGGIMLEVDEANTTRTCSDCGVVGGPRGLQGLRIREWRCECGAVQDRDVNAARNILRLGHQALAAGAAKAEMS